MIKNFLNNFGVEVIKYGRDRTIREAFEILNGAANDRLSQSISKQLPALSLEQKEALQKLIIDSVDGALNNFLWMIEQHEEFDLVAYDNGKTHSLREISDGLSVDYWNFVDDFSNFKRVDG